MNIFIEQLYNFLMYIKNKFKSLEQKDITVFLLVNEIHLKPYFNSEGVYILAYLTTVMKLQQMLLLVLGG